MNLDLQRLNSGERIAAGAALALFVCMFFSWFNFGYDTVTAWEGLHYISPILAIAIASTVGIAFMKATGRSLGDIPDGSVIFVLGGLATLLVLFRLVDPISAPGFEGVEENGSVEAGLFLGLLAAGGIAVGGYLATGGTALAQLKTLLPTQAPGPPPAAPHAPPPPPTPAPSASPPPPPPVAAAQPEPSPAPGGSFCEECGATIVGGDRFCSECGREQAPSPG